MEKKGIAFLAIIAIIITFFATWGITDIYYNPYGTQTYTINIDGSTTCFPIIDKAAEEFMGLYPDYVITVGAGGSGTGIAHVTDGITDIGMASRPVKSPPNENVTGNLKDFSFALDGIAIIFDADNTHGLTSLTMEQLVGIYNGIYDSWDDVGSTTSTTIIVVWNRVEGSGTRASFEDLTGLEEDLDYENDVANHLKAQSNGVMRTEISNNPNAIGFVGLGYLDNSVIGVEIDGIAPTIANVKNGSYKISRYLHLITNGEPNAASKAFLSFIFGPCGQQIVDDEGFVRLWG
ncbi:MAG: phosphate ABC transporter substrate-binding protein [Candidatus Lokiarchaeota archaeon]|nr:phosphate ABC transporter substrate-binding protein [Candidatus Lokiarchaeota archaeon]